MDLMQQAYTQAIQPLLEQAQKNLSDEEGAKDAIGKAPGWQRVGDLFGEDSKLFHDEKEAITKAITNIELGEFNLAYERCLANANPLEVSNMLGVARYFALLSSDPQNILGTDYSEKIAKCADP